VKVQELPLENASSHLRWTSIRTIGREFFAFHKGNVSAHRAHKTQVLVCYELQCETSSQGAPFWTVTL